MSSSDESEYRVEPFNKRKHKRSNFKCGVGSLDRYLKKQANQDFKRNITVPFVLVKNEESDIIGFYTLSSFYVHLEELPTNIRKKLPHYPNVPATLLGRLAVDEKYQGRGLGEFLLMDALHKSLMQTNKIASFSVVVDAINEDARNFYLHFGFLSFPNRKGRLFLPIDIINEVFLDGRDC